MMPTGWPFSIGETVILLTTIGSVTVSIITALKTQGIATGQDVIKRELQVVRQDTNGRLTEVTTELRFTKDQLDAAVRHIQQQEDTRATLAKEAADALKKVSTNPIKVIAESPLPVRVVDAPSTRVREEFSPQPPSS